MASLSSLPAELLELVVVSSSSILSTADVVRLAKCDKRLRNCLNDSTSVWRARFQADHPELFREIAEESAFVDWKRKLEERANCVKAIKNILRGFSESFWHCEDLSDSDIEPRVAGPCEEFGHHVVIDSLRELRARWTETGELTFNYYNEKVLKYLLQRGLSSQLSRLLDEGSDGHLVEERCLAAVAQWLQWDKRVVYAAGVRSWLDEAASDAKKRLIDTESLPAHRLAAQDWNQTECCAVIDAVRHVLFTSRDLKGNSDNYYDVKNSMIDVVLERRLGIPILLSLVFRVVAQRLGLDVVPVNLPAHFMLRLRIPGGGADTEENDNDGRLYIDCFDQGKVLTFLQAQAKVRQFNLEPSDECFTAVPTTRQVLIRVVANILRCVRDDDEMRDVRSVLELYEAVKSDDPSSPEGELDNPLLTLCEIYMRFRVNCDRVEAILSKRGRSGQHSAIGEVELRQFITVAQIRQTEVEASRRKTLLNRNFVKTRSVMTSEHNGEMGIFGVGMVMKHQRYDYECVIYGWDEVCKAGKGWIMHMGVHKLPRADRQPFYNVLVSDGSERYAAEENLEPILCRDDDDDGGSTVPKITHHQVGRFFSSFDGKRYLPNEELAVIYPEDAEFVKNFICNA